MLRSALVCSTLALAAGFHAPALARPAAPVLAHATPPLHALHTLHTLHALHALPPLFPKRSAALSRRARAVRASEESEATPAPEAVPEAVPTPKKDWKETAITFSLIAAWYATSIVCNQTSKKLLSRTTMGAQALTLVQMIVSAACGALWLFGLRLNPYKPFVNAKHVRSTFLCAGAFTGGFQALNACFAAMHVSLVMVLRAMEPITTLLLTGLMLPASEMPAFRRCLALLPVMIGSGLSAANPAYAPSLLGLALVTASNICFSLRNILGKQLKAEHGTDAYSLFFQLCVMGAGIQAATIGATALFTGAALPTVPVVAQAPLLLANGASFFAYLQLSWVCLVRMTAVSHSLANAMRRPATIAAALVVAPVALSPMNVAGIFLACAGAGLFALL